MPWKNLPFDNLEHYVINDKCEVVNTKVAPDPSQAKRTLLPTVRYGRLVHKLIDSEGKTVRIYPAEFITNLFPGLSAREFSVRTKLGMYSLLNELHAGYAPKTPDRPVEPVRKHASPLEETAYCASCDRDRPVRLFSHKEDMCDECFAERLRTIRQLVLNG